MFNFFNFWEVAEDTPPPPVRSAVFVMRNGRYEPQNLMPTLPRPDVLDFDGFVVRRGATAGYMNARPPEMRQASLIKTPVSVRRNSARVVRAGASSCSRGPSEEEAEEGLGDLAALAFSFDALRPGTIAVFLLATEVEVDVPPVAGAPAERHIRLVAQDAAAASSGGSESEPTSRPPILLAEQRFQAGLGQAYESPPLDLRWPVELLAYDPSRPRDIPLAVRLEADVIEGEEPSTHYTYLSLGKDPGRRPQWSVQMFAQKLQFGGQCFVLHEVFGASSKLPAPLPEHEEGGNSDCVICLSEPRDTAVLPCRHMCFCSYCAGIVRLQCDRCPVCRQKVASLLQFRRDRDGRPEELTIGLAPGGIPVPAGP